ncbi:MAG: hypothetical protein ABGY96_03495 [bacterium]
MVASDPADGTTELIEIFNWVGERVPELVRREVNEQHQLVAEFRRRKAGGSRPAQSRNIEGGSLRIQRPGSVVPPHFRSIRPGTRSP